MRQSLARRRMRSLATVAALRNGCVGPGRFTGVDRRHRLAALRGHAGTWCRPRRPELLVRADQLAPAHGRVGRRAVLRIQRVLQELGRWHERLLDQGPLHEDPGPHGGSRWSDVLGEHHGEAGARQRSRTRSSNPRSPATQGSTRCTTPCSSRSPDTSGGDYWAGRVRTQGDLALAAALAASAEYYQDSWQRYGPANPVPPAPQWLPVAEAWSGRPRFRRRRLGGPHRPGGPPIIDYTVTAFPGGKTCSLSGPYSSGALTCSVTGPTSVPHTPSPSLRRTSTGPATGDHRTRHPDRAPLRAESRLATAGLDRRPCPGRLVG